MDDRFKPESVIGMGQNMQQLNWLLDGYDVMRMQPHKRLHYSSVL